MLENESIWPVLGILAISQVLYNYSDVISRRHLANGEWSLRSVFRPWLAWYYAVRSAAVVGTLYVIARMPVGEVMAMTAALSIVLASAMGFFMLGERLRRIEAVGALAAVLAMLLVGLDFSPEASRSA